MDSERRRKNIKLMYARSTFSHGLVHVFAVLTDRGLVGALALPWPTDLLLRGLGNGLLDLFIIGCLVLAVGRVFVFLSDKIGQRRLAGSFPQASPPAGRCRGWKDRRRTRIRSPRPMEAAECYRSSAVQNGRCRLRRRCRRHRRRRKCAASQPLGWERRQLRACPGSIAHCCGVNWL